LVVWWPWLLLWVLTLAALVIAGWLLFAHVRTWRRAPAWHASRGVCLYLDDDCVMDLYQQGVYKTALRHEVEEKIHSAKDAKISAEFPGVGLGAGRTVDREIFRKYIEVAEPITVIGIIMAVLENADDIVYADLTDNTLEPGKALNRALRPMHGHDLGRPGAVGLRELEALDAFISIKGRYRKVPEANGHDTVTLSAWYGDSSGPGPQPKISVTCAAERLRRSVPPDAFQARCLGRIQGWRSETRELVVDPIAIFM